MILVFSLPFKSLRDKARGNYIIPNRGEGISQSSSVVTFIIHRTHAPNAPPNAPINTHLSPPQKSRGKRGDDVRRTVYTTTRYPYTAPLKNYDGPLIFLLNLGGGFENVNTGPLRTLFPNCRDAPTVSCNIGLGSCRRLGLDISGDGGVNTPESSHGRGGSRGAERAYSWNCST